MSVSKTIWAFKPQKVPKEVSTKSSLNLTRSETLMLPKILLGHSLEIVMLPVLLLNWKSMWTPLCGTFCGFRSPNGLPERHLLKCPPIFSLKILNSVFRLVTLPVPVTI